MPSSFFGLERIGRIGRQVLSLPWWIFYCSTGLAVILHVGFRNPWQPDTPFLTVVDRWPVGSSWDSSVAWILPARLGSWYVTHWEMFWVLTLIASWVLLGWLLPRTIPAPNNRLFILGLAASGVPVVLLTSIGMYDQLFLTGALVASLATNRLWVAGALIMATSNPEMGVVAASAALLVGWGIQDSRAVRRSVVIMLTSSAVMVVVSVARHLAGVDASESRLLYFPANAIRSLTLNVPWTPTTIATMYLGAWLLVCLICFGVEGRLRTIAVVLGLAVLPCLAAFTTLDGTRVGVVTSSLPFLIALRTWCMRWRPPDTIAAAPYLSVALICLLLLVPSLQILPYAAESSLIPPWSGFERLVATLRAYVF